MTRTRIDQAIELAATAHQGQRYGEFPYIVHVVQVAMGLQAEGADEDTVIAGLLHDIVEDTEVTLEDIIATFGPRVGGMVAGVTKHEDETYDDYRERIPVIALKVKVMDTTKNLAGLDTAKMPSYKKDRLRARYEANLAHLVPEAAR